MKRRLFLKGIGGAALAAPFLSSLHRPVRAQASTDPRRLIIFYTQNGCLTNRWFPEIGGTDGAVTAASLTTPVNGKPRTLAGLAPYASKLLFPRGLALYPAYGRGQTIDPHDQAMASKLTCAPIDSSGDRAAQSHSLDWEVARLFNQGAKEPLVLSVGNSFVDVKTIVSYEAAGVRRSPTTNPATVYGGLTGLFSGGDTEADYRVERGQSIIDLVSDDLQTFKRLNMSQTDQRRIDDWLDLLRDTEQKIIPAACNEDGAVGIGITSPPSGGGFGGPSIQSSDIMLQLIALTLMCDNSRSIIMQWPGFQVFNFEPLNHTIDHHGLSHRVGSAAVGGACVEGVLDRIAEIDDFYAERYVKLVSLLDSIEEGDGKLLDNSACMWLPELADGNAHNTNNLPIVIAGSAGGYLKQGVSVTVDGASFGGGGFPGGGGGGSSDPNHAGNSEGSCAGGTAGEEVSFNTGSNGGMVPLNKLYVTLINALGAGTPGFAPVDRFGVVDTSDLSAGITNPGELAALKA